MYIILIVVFLVGVLAKFADLAGDDGLKTRKLFSYSAGAIYGFLAAWILVSEYFLAPVVLGTVVAVLLSRKIDTIPHATGVASMMLFLGFWGFPPINLILLVVFALATIFDEIGNGMADRKKIKGKTGKIFSYMIISDLAALLVSYLTGAWIILLGVLVFDAGYLLTEKAGKGAKAVSKHCGKK